MSLRNSLLGLVLLALAAALPSHGWAQGTMARITAAVVLCGAGDGAVHLIDWQGQPVELHPDCPDCLPGFAAADLSVPPDAQRPAGVARALSVAPMRGLAPAHGPTSRQWPRAPPV